MEIYDILRIKQMGIGIEGDTIMNKLSKVFIGGFIGLIMTTNLMAETKIIPVPYKGKYLIDGSIIDSNPTSHKVYEENGKVFLPIRLAINGNWELTLKTNEDKTQELIINKKNEIIKLKIDSKVASVNGNKVELPDAVKKVDGNIVISLESIKELSKQYLYYEDNMVVLADKPVTWEDIKTKGSMQNNKKLLTDIRKRNEEYMDGITKYNEYVYFSRQEQYKDGYHNVLYKQKGKERARKITLPGIVDQYIAQEHMIWFTTTIKNESYLYRYMLQNGKIQQVANITKQTRWQASDGWIDSIRSYNGQNYLVLHSGDNTMGAESLYLLKEQKLLPITGAKQFGSIIFEKDKLYYSDFHPMGKIEDNLYVVDLVTKEKRAIGNQGYVYDIYTYQKDGWESTYIKKQVRIIEYKLYTLGYEETDEGAVSCVYEISLQDNTQKKITLPASNFWIQKEEIYYIDSTMGYLVKCNLDGSSKKTIVSQKIREIKEENGVFYYTIENKEGEQIPGIYKYSVEYPGISKISNHIAKELITNASGIYYVVDQYEPGIYKMTNTGNKCIVKDWIKDVLDTGKVILYTLEYEIGIYAAK